MQQVPEPRGQAPPNHRSVARSSFHLRNVWDSHTQPRGTRTHAWPVPRPGVTTCLTATLAVPSHPVPSCRYPHDVVNHLSCDEAKNHYGGVVSLIPLVMDVMKEWIAHSEKLPRKALQQVSVSPAQQIAMEAAAHALAGLRKLKFRQLRKDSLRPRGRDKGHAKPPWRPPCGKL